MVPVKMISPPPWMSDERSVRLMKVLGGYKVKPESLFVGGCVRNALLDKRVNDIDIATVYKPLEVIEKLKAAGIRFVPTGLDHGTITALVDDLSYEITTLRKDIETDGRYAVIAFSTEWKEDAQRRDFTINTLLAGADGSIYDPTGQGLSDLEARRVVFVGEADGRIAEDYLRILRFFRFYAEYGVGAADPAALAACRKHADKLSLLSRERITQEFLKILAVHHAASILSLMFSQDVLKDIGKGFKEPVMEHICALQVKFESVDVIARLCVLSNMKGESFEERLVLSNAQKKNLKLFAESFSLIKSVSKKKIRELVYRFGNASALQGYFLHQSQKQQPPDFEMIDIARYWQAPEFPVKADSLIEAGVPRGPELGKKLSELEEKWIAKDFPLDFSFKK